VPFPDSLKVKVFADGADVAGIRKAAGEPLIAGFTTNPALMRRAGVENYERFAREALDAAGGKPISFEVTSDDFDDMGRQARKIARWGENVFVKVPVTNTVGRSSCDLIRLLVGEGVQVNVTAILTLDQVTDVVAALEGCRSSYVSVFAGRIADTGVDPLPVMRSAVTIVHSCEAAQLIWASPREILNVVQADAIGCDVITVTADLLSKLALLGRDLGDYSLDTVRMFYTDATSAGYEL
jgi:transaldolase